jgi:hypothetical protein
MPQILGLAVPGCAAHCANRMVSGVLCLAASVCAVQMATGVLCVAAVGVPECKWCA